MSRHCPVCHQKLPQGISLQHIHSRLHDLTIKAAKQKERELKRELKSQKQREIAEAKSQWMREGARAREAELEKKESAMDRERARHARQELQLRNEVELWKRKLERLKSEERGDEAE